MIVSQVIDSTLLLHSLFSTLSVLRQCWLVTEIVQDLLILHNFMRYGPIFITTASWLYIGGRLSNPGL